MLSGSEDSGIQRTRGSIQAGSSDWTAPQLFLLFSYSGSKTARQILFAKINLLCEEETLSMNHRS